MDLRRTDGKSVSIDEDRKSTVWTREGNGRPGWGDSVTYRKKTQGVSET